VAALLDADDVATVELVGDEGRTQDLVAPVSAWPRPEPLKTYLPEQRVLGAISDHQLRCVVRHEWFLVAGGPVLRTDGVVQQREESRVAAVLVSQSPPAFRSAQRFIDGARVNVGRDVDGVDALPLSPGPLVGRSQRAELYFEQQPLLRCADPGIEEQAERLVSTRLHSARTVGKSPSSNGSARTTSRQLRSPRHHGLLSSR